MFGVQDAVTLPYQPHSATSRAAAGRMIPKAGTDREAVLALLVRKPAGLTDEEIQHALGINPSTQRPRRIELVRDGKVRDSGRVRKTTSGRDAAVWEVSGGV
jgi:transcription initiation factor IIE alpha subunit